MLRNYPLEPIGQILLLSKCGRLKAWMLKAFSNQNDPVILWVFLLYHIESIPKKCFSSAFPQKPGVIMSGALGAGAGENQTHYVHSYALAHCRTPVPRFDTEMSLHEFSIEHMPQLCKTTIWGFFWEYWHQSVGCKIVSYLFSLPDHKVGFRIGCFLKWRIFYCGIWLLAHRGAVMKKKSLYF